MRPLKNKLFTHEITINKRIINRYFLQIMNLKIHFHEPFLLPEIDFLFILALQHFNSDKLVLYL